MGCQWMSCHVMSCHGMGWDRCARILLPSSSDAVRVRVSLRLLLLRVSYKCSALSGVNIKEACSQLVNRIAENNVAELKQAENDKGERGGGGGGQQTTWHGMAWHHITCDDSMRWRRCVMHIRDMRYTHDSCVIYAHVYASQRKRLKHNSVNNHDRSRMHIHAHHTIRHPACIMPHAVFCCRHSHLLHEHVLMSVAFNPPPPPPPLGVAVRSALLHVLLLCCTSSLCCCCVRAAC